MIQTTIQPNLQSTLLAATTGAIGGSLLTLAPFIGGATSCVTGAIFGGIEGGLWEISLILLPNNLGIDERIAGVIADVGRALVTCAASVMLTSALGFPITFTTGLYLTAAMLLTFMAIATLFARSDARTMRAFV